MDRPNVSEGNQAESAFIAERGIPVTRAEVAALLGLSIVMFALKNWEMGLLSLILLALFGYLSRYSAKPVLVLRTDLLEYRTGKVLATASWSEISDVVIRGNALVGRSILIKGSFLVSTSGEKPAKRQSIDISDVFAGGVEELQKVISVYHRSDPGDSDSRFHR